MFRIFFELDGPLVVARPAGDPAVTGPSDHDAVRYYGPFSERGPATLPGSNSGSGCHRFMAVAGSEHASSGVPIQPSSMSLSGILQNGPQECIPVGTSHEDLSLLREQHSLAVAAA